MRSILFVFLILGAMPATAGAWLRAEGAAFLALSVLQSEESDTDGALYFEYGLRPQLTLGVKLDASMVARQLSDGSGFVFARLPISTGQRPFRLAYELGLGSTFGTNNDALVRTGLSYGRGVQWRERYGWLALDAAVEWSLGAAPHTVKLDTTFGMALTDQTKGMMQVFVSSTDDTTSVTVAPSLIWQPTQSKNSFQIGLEAERGVVSVRLGLWRDF